MKGMDPWKINRFSGHVSLNSLDKYIHPQQQEVKDAVLAHPLVTSEKTAPASTGREELKLNLTQMLASGAIDPATYRAALGALMPLDEKV